MSTTPDTIVLIHGFWATPRSWEHWKTHDESKGYTVLTPAYPGFEVEVGALNTDPTPIEKVTVPEIIDHLESVVDELERPPILIGHSAGGSSPRSCSITVSGRRAWQSIPHRPWASRSSHCHNSSPPFRC